MSNLPQPKLSTRIDYIDAWRFFAVALVIQSHLFLFSGISSAWIERFSLQLDRLGELGVLIFFVISGYVICSGLKHERQQTGSVCLPAFYVRRFFRIMPPLWLYLTAIALLSVLGRIDTTMPQGLTSFLFLCNMPFPEGCSWYLGHTWSLAYEEQFYLLFPFLFLSAPIIGGKTQSGQFILVLAMLSIVCRLAGWVFFADYAGYFIFLLTGCWAALQDAVWQQRLRRVSVWVWLGVLLILLTGIMLLPVAAEKYAKTLVYPVLILIVVLATPTHTTWVAGIFGNRTVCYLGRISYSVYLWQELVTEHYAGWLTAFNIAAVFGFAGLSFHYFEMPLQRLGHKVSGRLRQSGEKVEKNRVA